MIKLKSWDTFLFFTTAYPARSLFMVLALVVAGFLEGIGVMALLPLVAILTEQDTLGDGIILNIVEQVFHFIHLDMSIGSILTFIVAAIFLKSIITMMAMAQVSYSTSHVCADLQLSYLRNLLQSRWAHFTGLKSGTSANALGTEAQRSAVSFTQGCYVLAWGVQVIVYTILAFMISLPLTLSAVGAGFIMIFLLGFLVRTGRKAGQDQTKILNSVLTRITDTLYGAKPLIAMGKTNNLLAMMEADTKTLQSSQIRVELSKHAVRVLSEPIMILFVALGMYAILEYGHLPVTQLLFLALIFLRMVMKISAVQNAYLSMATHESALWSLKAKIDAAKDAVDDNGGTAEPRFKKGIKLDAVSFSYDNHVILNTITLNIATRGFYVLFGASGGGKTTLLDLIIGLHKPSSGTIYIDDTPLSSLNMKDWRHKIGYVPQDILLFHDTIANNVTLNDPTIMPEQIIAALKMADAYDFVKKMEHGLETIVGERGTKLSGGQRQRIAIARALINNPSILVLDEATNALDKSTEQDLMKTVKALSKDILVLCISHNTNSLNEADTVLKLTNGQLSIIPHDQIERLIQ